MFMRACSFAIGFVAAVPAVADVVVYSTPAGYTWGWGEFGAPPATGERMLDVTLPPSQPALGPVGIRRVIDLHQVPPPGHTFGTHHAVVWGDAGVAAASPGQQVGSAMSFQTELLTAVSYASPTVPGFTPMLGERAYIAVRHVAAGGGSRYGWIELIADHQLRAYRVIRWASETRVDVAIIVPCYANCDQSTAAPTLNVADFTCFLQSFAAGCS